MKNTVRPERSEGFDLRASDPSLRSGRIVVMLLGPTLL